MDELLTIAIERTIREILNNDKIVEKISEQKNEYELLSAQQISNETGIAPQKVRELFNTYTDELGVQTYTKPMLITRKKWNDFISVRR
jgi:NADH/NAD ratio-sensing transcriptional regulator Rex